MKDLFIPEVNLEIRPEVNFVINPIFSTDELIDAYEQHKKLGYWNLMIFRKGNGMVWIDLKSYAISDNCVLIVKPGQSFATKNTMLHGFLLSFKGCCTHPDDVKCDSDNPARLLRFFSKPLLFLSNDIMNDTKETIGKMIKELGGESPYRSELLKRYFKIMLIYMTRNSNYEIEDPWQNKNIQLVERFLLLLEKSYTEKKMVSDYALALFVSANYLNQMVKKITGESAGAHIRNRIILEAKRKAVYSNYSMKEIGYLLGFDDPSHFSKLFKKTTGINFADFRKELLPIPCIPEIKSSSYFK